MKKVLQTIVCNVFIYQARFKILNMNKNRTVRLSVKIITENIKYS